LRRYLSRRLLLVAQSAWKPLYSASYLSLRRKAAELDREGQSLEAIARYFNEQGYASRSGKSWTHFMVDHLLRDNGHKQEPLENIHRNAIAEAQERGLNYQQIADEFNKKNLRRRGSCGGQQRVWPYGGVILVVCNVNKSSKH
jgi:hypothetical protein